MPGLIHIDCNGGDHSFILVDDALWEQIKKINITENNRSRSWSIIMYLADDNPDREFEEWALKNGYPIRQGVVLAKASTQRGVVENLPDFGWFANIKGILTVEA